MGNIVFGYNNSLKAWTAKPRPDAVWNFKVIGNNINGTLIFRDKLFRIVTLKND